MPSTVHNIAETDQASAKHREEAPKIQPTSKLGLLKDYFFNRQQTDTLPEAEKDNKILAELKSLQPGYLATSKEFYTAIFKSNPIWSTANMLMHATEGIVNVAPFYFLGKLIENSNVSVSAVIGLCCCWAARSAVDSLRPLISHGFTFNADKTFNEKIQRGVNSRSSGTQNSPGFNDVLNSLRENLHRVSSFVDRNLSICSGALSCGLAASAILTSSPMIAVAITGLGVLELYSSIRSAKRFEKTEEGTADVRRQFIYQNWYVSVREAIRGY